MRQARFLFASILIWGVIGCSENALSPEESAFPEKLFPYEPLFDLEALQQRRDALVAQLPSDALVLITTNQLYTRNGDITYEFRPASTFYYLTGFDEPNAAAIVSRGEVASELIMFVEQRDEGETRWLGPSYGPEGAVQYFGAAQAYSIDHLEAMLGLYVERSAFSRVYANLEDNTQFAETFSRTPAGALELFDVDAVVDVLRYVKSDSEIDAIRKASKVSVQAFSEAMKAVKPGMYEYEIDAVLDYVLRVNGSTRAAFPTIVASGPNSEVLHYVANQRQMQDGELVMIDFGAEYAYYASDLTRTLPVSGTFTPAQATIYKVVLKAYRSVMEAAKPGVAYTYLYELARDVVLEELVSEAVIAGDPATLIATNEYRRYIPAGLGHSVGLDDHDPFPAIDGSNKVLRENMVMAFEPHVYLSGNDPTVAEAYRGVCVRIEDTVLITADGVEVLSGDLPIEIDEIEKRMK